MGIKDLWTIFRPFGERKPLFELQGKTVAIDLSCWVCEAQNITEHTVQPRMYLRNLYFRTCYLLLLGVNPVYVLEGRAPTMKYDTIAARNALQFKGKKPKTEKTKCKDRSHFNHTLKLCEDMLRYMGITCIKAKGEAEAMCAYLNANELVDGCITQDSDCFAYGAKTVFRNFSISQQGLSSANGGAVDEYNIGKLESNTGIGRLKIVALALICGSDYSSGIFGVGKESLLKLFDGIPDADILQRLRFWKTNMEYYENLEKNLLIQNICSACGHVGKLVLHDKDGCSYCDTSKGCTTVEHSSSSKDQKIFVKNEINIRKKALASPNFPDEELINEYLNNEESIENFSVDWTQPNIFKFVEFAKKYLQWDEIYAYEKFLPVVTRWHLKKCNSKNDPNHRSIENTLKPSCIKKVRNPKGIPSYEIIWIDIKETHKLIIPPEQLDTTNVKLLTTIEPQQLVEEAYPELVENFKLSRVKPKTTKRRKQKTKKDELKTKQSGDCNELQELASNKNDETNIQTRLSMYFSKGSSNVIADENLDMSNFGDENDLNLSDIVENILNCNQPLYIKEHLKKIQSNNLESSFFMKISTEADLFEQTFTNINYLGTSEDSDSCE